MSAVSQLELSLKADAPWEIKWATAVSVHHDFFAKALSMWKVATARIPEGYTVLDSFPQPLYHRDMVCLQLFYFMVLRITVTLHQTPASSVYECAITQLSPTNSSLKLWWETRVRMQIIHSIIIYVLSHLSFICCFLVSTALKEFRCHKSNARVERHIFHHKGNCAVSLQNHK